MHFPARAALILFSSIFGHKIGVQKNPQLCPKEKRVASYALQGHIVLLVQLIANYKNESEDDHTKCTKCLGLLPKTTEGY